ncbi:creatininase family protein [Peribacillus glennii]|uniref:Creatininase family protein n=1 Tax=Peribacillus glennii TaxID=2303991 RepID=A0A372LF90_9BACI|nr:creatininase family protein [Peribacillus glennii]RFU64948.1 creatininase family protein [Peribacillus glennii]
MSFIDLKYLTSSEAKEAAMNQSAVGLIPIGAFEQHGPHLPLGTDSIMVEVLASEVAARCSEPIIVTPTLMAGLSSHHLDFPGTVSLEPATLGSELASYINALSNMGLTRVCLLSFHGGNFNFIGEYADNCNINRPNIQVEAYNDFHRFLHVMFEAGVEAGLILAPTDSHAGALETSLILHVLGKKRVRPFEMVNGYTAGDPGWMEIMQAKGVSAISPSGVFGNPFGASPEAGEAILNALVEEVVIWMKETFSLKTTS